MKYDHMIKKNGIYYAAGEEVPEDEEMTVEESLPSFPETSEQKPYTKTEIQRMSVDSLRILAKEVGIENPEEISGSEIKNLLLSHFGL